MSSPKFAVYEGTEAQSEDLHYSQVVTVGNIVKTSGQGGWDAHGNMSADLQTQAELAFDNVLRAMRAANPQLSWANVYSVRSYHIDIKLSAEFVIAGFKKHTPNRKPIWTCVEIAKLGLEGMQVEIEVEATL